MGRGSYVRRPVHRREDASRRPQREAGQTPPVAVGPTAAAGPATRTEPPVTTPGPAAAPRTPTWARVGASGHPSVGGQVVPPRSQIARPTGAASRALPKPLRARKTPRHVTGVEEVDASPKPRTGPDLTFLRRRGRRGRAAGALVSAGLDTPARARPSRSPVARQTYPPVPRHRVRAGQSPR